MRNKKLALLALGLTLPVVAVLHFERSALPFTDITPLWNAGHGAAFALVAWLACAAFGVDERRGGEPRYRGHCLRWAVAGLAGVALLLELAQLPTVRDADPWDLVRDLAGIGLGVLLYMRFGRTLAAGETRRGLLARRSVAVTAGTVAVAIIVAPLVLAATGAAARQARAPMLLRFESPLERLDYRALRAGLRHVPRQADWPVIPGEERVLSLELQAGSARSGLDVAQVIGDWTAFGCLTFEAAPATPGMDRLVVRITDRHREPGSPDGYERTIELEPGYASYAIPVAEIRDRAHPRPLALDAVAGMLIFVSDAEQPGAVLLDRIALAGDCPMGESD